MGSIPTPDTTIMLLHFRPIVAFEFILSGKPVVYHTDGIKLIGPTLTDTRPNLATERYVVISYLSFIAPQDDSPDDYLWHRELYTLYFPTIDVHVMVLKEIMAGYRVIYDWLMENAPIDKCNPLTPFYGYFIPEYPSLSELQTHLTI